MMNYCIISIDDKRKRYIYALEETLRGWKRQYPYCVDGRDKVDLEFAVEHFGYDINTDNIRVGQLGVWYSVLHAIDLAPIVTFEDDALLGPMFKWQAEKRISELPDDTDFFSLFLPRDSDHLWTPDLSVSTYLTRTYQRYGGVSMYYTRQGVEKIRALLRRDGITGQYDDTLYAYSKAGELNGYCSKPQYTDLVYITGHENSIVQETDYYAG